MLSNNGSAQLSFIITFLIIFFLCGLYCFFVTESDYFSKFSKSFEADKSQESSDDYYEAKLKEATRKYIDDYYGDLEDGGRLIIKLATLENYNYISLNNCTGYSIVSKNGIITIESYVNCNNYQSDDYNKEYE